MLKRLAKLSVSLAVHCWDRLAEFGTLLAGKTPPPRAVVLYYHGVSDQERSRFARQMAMLARQVKPIACDPESLRPGHRYAAVSFDDGFASVVKNALPVLKERQIPATVFIPTGYFGVSPGWVKSEGILSRGEIILTEPEVKELSNEPLVSIGSHTVTHPRLAAIPPDKAAEELEQSKRSLETMLARKIDLFSFPHGSFNDHVLQLAQRAGYRRVFSIKPALAFTHPREFVTGRVAVDPSDWSLEFVLKVNGAYRWLARP